MVAAHSLTFNPAKYGDGMIQDNLTVSPLIVAYMLVSIECIVQSGRDCMAADTAVYYRTTINGPALNPYKAPRCF